MEQDQDKLVHIYGVRLELKKNIVFFCLKICFTFTNSVDPDEMQHIMLHFIWVFTVCKCTCLEVTRIQRVKKQENKFKITLIRKPVIQTTHNTNLKESES